jgi:hypothetical protein
MENKVNFFDIPIKKIKDRLKIRNIKGKEYYYLKIKFGLKTDHYSGEKAKEIYVCPKDVGEKELRCSYCLARKKLFMYMLQFFYELSKKYHKSKYITDKERKLLEFLSFGYNIVLKQYNESDKKRYEDVVYTKYVYGTTSIEGNTYSLRETELTLNEGLTVSGKEKREFYEIENYNKLKDFLNKQKRIILIMIVRGSLEK